MTKNELMWRIRFRVANRRTRPDKEMDNILKLCILDGVSSVKWFGQTIRIDFSNGIWIEILNPVPGTVFPSPFKISIPKSDGFEKDTVAVFSGIRPSSDIALYIAKEIEAAERANIKKISEMFSDFVATKTIKKRKPKVWKKQYGNKRKTYKPHQKQQANDR